METVVVDTNIFINSFFGRGFFKNDEAILDLEENGIVQFAFSQVTFNELCKLMCDKIVEFDMFECSDILEAIVDIRKRSVYVDSANKIRPPLSTDKGDQFFIELAAHLDLPYLITNDHANGLLDLGVYNSTKIVTPSQFMKEYNKRKKKA